MQWRRCNGPKRRIKILKIEGNIAGKACKPKKSDIVRINDANRGDDMRIAIKNW